MTDFTDFRLQMPLFGECKLQRREAHEVPAIPIGYVQFEGKPDNLTAAIWQRGAWHTRGGKPMRTPITAWYSIERPDGKPFP